MATPVNDPCCETQHEEVAEEKITAEYVKRYRPISARLSLAKPISNLHGESAFGLKPKSKIAWSACWYVGSEMGPRQGVSYKDWWRC